MIDTVQTTPAPEAPASAPAPEAKVETPAPSRRDVMLEQANKLLSKEDKAAAVDDAKSAVEPPNGKDRHPDGKFKGKDPATGASGEDGKPPVAEDGKADAKAEADEKKDDKPTEKPQLQRNLPSHWRLSDTVRDALAAAPVEVQDAIAQLANKDRQNLSRLGRDLDALRPMGETLRELDGYIKAVGTPAHELMRSFAAWDIALRRDPETALPKFLSAYGIEMPSEQPVADPSGLPPDPEVTALRRQNDALQKRLDALERHTGGITSRLTEREQQERAYAERQETARFETLQEQVARFAKDKPDFQTLVDSGDLEIEINALRARGVPDDQLLQMAYDRASHANPVTRDKLIRTKLSEADKTRAAEAERAAKEAKRAGAINVRGAPENHAPPASLRDAQNAVLQKFGLSTLTDYR